MVQDYNQPCCQKPYCDFSGSTGQITGQATTLAPIPGVSTLAPNPVVNPTLAPTPKSRLYILYPCLNAVNFRICLPLHSEIH